MTTPFEVDGATLRTLGRFVVDKLATYLDQQPDRPALRTTGSHKAARRFDAPLPEGPTPFRRLVARILDEAVPPGLDPAHPGYLAFIPGGGLPQAALADLISGVVNRYTGLWKPAPALVQAEISVINGLCEVVGLVGPAAGGLLTSGGSLANLGAVVAARQAQDTDDLRLLRGYCTAQTHHSIQKAWRTAGLRPRNLVVVAHDSAFQMDVDALHHAILADEAAGLRPTIVAANAGCTPVGAVDPLSAVADVTDEHGVWLHVDGAYGGAFALTERGRRRLDGLHRADSITLDPHKGLFVPYGTGALLVADRATLRRAFATEASYLPTPEDHDQHWDFADLGPELSRPARGLGLWLPLHLHGLARFRQELDEKLDLAQLAHRRIAALPHVRIVAAPALSLFAFRVEPPGKDADTTTRRVLSAVGRAGRVCLSGATVCEAGQSVFVARVCVLSFRTHRPQIDALVSDLEDAIAEVAS